MGRMMLRKPWTLTRAAFAVAYAVAGVAGVAALNVTPPSMAEQIGVTWATVWGVYVFVGAGGCLVGILTGVWLWEYVCVHLLGSAMAVYAGIIFTTVEGVPGRSVGALLLVVLSLVLFARWATVHAEAQSDTRPPTS